MAATLLHSRVSVKCISGHQVTLKMRSLCVQNCLKRGKRDRTPISLLAVQYYYIITGLMRWVQQAIRGIAQSQVFRVSITNVPAGVHRWITANLGQSALLITNGILIFTPAALTGPLLATMGFLALGLLFFRAPPMITMIKSSQRDSTAFWSSIVCSSLSRQGGLCEGFTSTVAHEALPPYLT